ncbi:uncharacterized protein LOC111707416 [Eurytemora carolleeae]|uniref:uncharacterized protein LOC111707416 n=1 Tax=Eurytemora carolleeae TaxID=1294199 RepID=UPI000C791D61|nr:uncharacterized protein LOC111707416 [Eurytemora carolleeae]|eukprot:XP_023336287.1 uncharacterized protein LOC111707416 [Eurytemora affinis]
MPELQYIKSRKDFDRMVDAASLYLKQKNSCNLKLKSNSKIDTCSSDDNSDIDIDVENCAEENLNVIKEEKNKEECETQEPSQVILRECKDEIYSGSEKIKVWTKTEELEFMEAKADRKKFDDEMQILELEIENNRKEEELDNLFEKENEVYRDKLEKELTISQIKDWFRKNINYLKDIWSGKIQSDRHDIYIAGGRPARDLIFYTILDPFTVDQQDCAFREMEKVWMKTKEEKRENWEYIEKVLLSEFLIKLYGDFFGIHKRQEYEVHNSNCPITLLTK